MNLNKQTYIAAGIILTALAIGSFYLLKEPVQNKNNADTPNEGSIYLKADTGLNIEYIEVQSVVNSVSSRERAIFERYRFYDAKTDEQIDIRSEDIRVFVTPPAGIEEEITTGNIFYLMQIYPFSESGEYKFRLEMPDGAENSAKLDFLQPKAVNIGFNEPENGLNSGMKAVNMEGIDINNINFIYHILADNTVKELHPNNKGEILIDVEVIEEDHHIFLTKQEGVWHYAQIINSEE